MPKFTKLSFVPLTAVWALSSCSTPLQDCVSRATGDYNSTVQAISVAQGNVARGYAISYQSVPYQSIGVCYNGYGSYSCMQTNYRTQESPVSIDVSEERYKIQQYSAMLPALKRQAEAGSAQCQKEFPEK